MVHLRSSIFPHLPGLSASTRPNAPAAPRHNLLALPTARGRRGLSLRLTVRPSVFWRILPSACGRAARRHTGRFGLRWVRSIGRRRGLLRQGVTHDPQDGVIHQIGPPQGDVVMGTVAGDERPMPQIRRYVEHAWGFGRQVFRKSTLHRWISSPRGCLLKGASHDSSIGAPSPLARYALEGTPG